MGGHIACRLASAPNSVNLFQSIFACCPPLDLFSTALHIDQSSWRIYRTYLVEGIKILPRRILAHANRGQFALTPYQREGLELSLEADTLRGFDNYAISRLLGYECAEDYYMHESAAQYIDQIHTPTVCAFNEFDPLIPVDEQRLAIQSHLHPHPLLSVKNYRRGGHIYGGGFFNHKSALGALIRWIQDCYKNDTETCMVDI